LATLLERAALHATTPFRQPATLHEDRRATHAALGDAPVEPGAALGSHAPFDMMSRVTGLALHPDQFAPFEEFVPAETTDYITRP
jgi:hypothetical protein